MATGTIKNDSQLNDFIKGTKKYVLYLQTQSGWTVGGASVFSHSKPTIVGGVIAGERALTTAEVSAFNSALTFEPNIIRFQTTNSLIAQLSGKFIHMDITTT